MEIILTYLVVFGPLFIKCKLFYFIVNKHYHLMMLKMYQI